MEEKYSVTYESREVGTAILKLDGLYYFLQLECVLPKNRVHRAFIISENKKLPLGVCTPKGSRFYIEKKIAAKNIPKGRLSFCIGQNNENRVDCTLPWNKIDRIRYAYLAMNGTEKEIAFKCPAKCQQGNDPSQGPARK